MLLSMTGFSRKTQTADWGTLTWELRSVNHRYLDISLRVPETFRPLEPVYRAAIAAQVRRGKVEATLKFQAGEALPFRWHLNQSLLSQLSSVSMSMQAAFPGATTNVPDMLSWPGVLRMEETGMDAVHAASQTLLTSAVQGLLALREKEGAGLMHFFQERIAKLRQQIEQVSSAMPAVLAEANQRMQARFQALSLELDQQRFEQEIVWLAQKLDIAEELKRLTLHIAALEKSFSQGAAVGRRLDFLMQELNREANTLASKSIDANVTHAAVEMKVIIEQMREQVQNIE